MNVGCIFWCTSMPHLEDKDLIPWILDKFARHGWWGAKHTSFENIPKGAPQHMRGAIKNAADRLITENFLIPKPTGYGLEVSLNFERKEEIFSIIERWKINQCDRRQACPPRRTRCIMSLTT